MLGKTLELAGETGITGFAKREAPAYITGNFAETERPERKARSANRNGYYDAECKWHGGYFDDNGMFVEGHEVHTLFGMPYGFGQMIMIPVCLVLMYLAIVKGFEPLLLLPIGFGGLLANCPLSGITAPAMMHDGVISFLASGIPVMSGGVVEPGGFLHYFFRFGIDTGVFPIMIFMGVGAMTDFGPLIANPKSALLGGAAQLGIFFALFGALGLSSMFTDLGFGIKEASAIGIIGGADGPTAIWLTSRLAPDLLGAIAVAAYSYMALVPIIQPPIMKALTTKEERLIKMPQLRNVTKIEKVAFPLIVLLLCAILLPSAVPLIGALMLGNLAKEVGTSVSRIADTMSNALINIVTIMLGLSVGSKLACEKFLSGQTLAILALGLCAFCVGTAGGVLMAKLMNVFSKEKVNPLIGSAGVSAVPMAARVSNKVALEEDPTNFILMQAMGPNVSGVIGSAVVAGVLYTLCR
ncbi:MAG: sodium ion-translocating decarboxylase subunit beta [Kiritimatiellae bacterium]|nr:sodium ion-translocating decarboxylase subunit beta [Kiritimatiellia bacterium]